MGNEHLFWVGVSCGIWYDEEPREIFPLPIDKRVARYCRSTEEAVELLTRYTHSRGPGNSLLATAAGSHWSSEACRRMALTRHTGRRPITGISFPGSGSTKCGTEKRGCANRGKA